MGHERDLAGAGELIAIEATESLLQDGDVPARIGAETVLAHENIIVHRG